MKSLILECHDVECRMKHGNKIQNGNDYCLWVLLPGKTQK